MSQTPNQLTRTLERREELHLEPEQLHTEAQPQQVELAPAQQEQTQRQTQLNAQLVDAVQQQLAPAQAQQTAEGAPVQVEAPAKQSYKERQREKKHAKAARKACPVGTAATYDMVKQLSLLSDGKSNAMREHRDLIQRQGVDKRVLKVFAPPYQVNKKGQPATPEDAAVKQTADAFIQDYCSNDWKRRRPHLDRMVDELLSIRYSADMFSPQNLRRNAAQLKAAGDKMVYMDNVMKDPVNKPYFEAMDPVRRQQLDSAFRTLYTPFVGTLSMALQKQGVNFNMGGYYGYGDMDAIQMGQDMAPVLEENFQNLLPAYQQEMADAQARFDQQVPGCAADYAQRLREGERILAQLRQDPRLELAEEEKSSPFLTRSVMLLEPGDEHYEDNLKTVQLLLETGRLRSEVPTRDHYQRLRAALAPRVQKVLDCDVDALAALSDNALVLQMPLLNQLFMDNMFVADLMKTAHYNTKTCTAGPLSMKDDLVGTRLEEYSYKASMLRALSERARALSLLRAHEQGTLTDGCFTAGELTRAREDVPGWARSRLTMADNLQNGALEKRKKADTPGTEEFKERIRRNLRLFGSKGELNDTPLSQVGDDYELRDTPHKLAVMQRLHKEQYHSLAHSEEELEQKGLSTSIGEPLFRGFSGFLSMSAAEQLLTPEQFRQMLDDTGASEAEMPLQQAIEANQRGLASYKRILSAQFEMFERKYGNSLLDLSLDELVEHQSELLKDFSDLQVPLNMVTKLPGFIDPDVPGDMELKQRVEYYSVIGKTVADLFSWMLTGDNREAVEKAVSDYKQFCSTLPPMLAGIQGMEAHRPAYRHPVDWSQGVRDPDAPA